MKQRYDEAIDRAIKIHQGEILPIGTVCAHPSDSMAYKLIGYDGNTALLSYNGITKKFPASEIFDVNKVRDTAIQINLEMQIENYESN